MTMQSPTPRKTSHRPPLLRCLLSALCLVAGTATAASAAHAPTAATVAQAAASAYALPAAPATANVVDITSTGKNFDMPEQIPSGWTTFRYRNATGMTHFAQIELLPAGIGIADQQLEVAPVFQEGMDLINAGMFNEALAAFGRLPAWFFGVVFTGGPGLTAPGHISETTVYLEPGTYLLECYVKQNGVFHSFNPSGDGYGMVREFSVTAQPSPAQEPRATLELSISSQDGIQVPDRIRPGRHTVAVRFADQIVHEHFLGHDVHLARLRDDTDMDALATWMNWSDPAGLDGPAPAEFLGGVNDMPAGSIAYMDILLTPGRYAWIAEVPDPAGKNMLKIFMVPGSRHFAN